MEMISCDVEQEDGLMHGIFPSDERFAGSLERVLSLQLSLR